MNTSDFLANLETPAIHAVYLPIDAIEPDMAQPRRSIGSLDGEMEPEEQEALEELAADIAAHGLLQPITVREVAPDAYRIIMGERRWLALKLNHSRGLPDSDRIPAFIRQDVLATELRLMQLSENLQRRDLTDVEVAKFLKVLLAENPGMKKQDLAKLLNRNSQYVSRILAISDPRWAHLVETGIITHASVLEQYKSLPEYRRAELVVRAQAENRSLTVKDIRESRSEERQARTQDAQQSTSRGAAGHTDSENHGVTLTLAELEFMLAHDMLGDKRRAVSIALSGTELKEITAALSEAISGDKAPMVKELLDRLCNR